MDGMKNISKAEVLTLRGQVAYHAGQVVSRTLAQNGLRHIRFHGLRHSSVTLLLAHGIPLKQIQEWLGHSDFSTTANIYAHLEAASKQNTAEAMLHGLGLEEE